MAAKEPVESQVAAQFVRVLFRGQRVQRCANSQAPAIPALVVIPFALDLLHRIDEFSERSVFVALFKIRHFVEF